MEGATTTVMDILESVGAVFSSGILYVSDIAETITEKPILLVFTVLPLVGLGVGLFKRLISVN